MMSVWGLHSKSKKKKKSFSQPAISREASIDGAVINGSRDEAFFDTLDSLASDCDEFHSVRGDLTPTYIDSPRSQFSKSIPGTPLSNKDPPIVPFPDTKSEHSPKKKFGLFLQEAPPGNVTEEKLTDIGKLDETESKLTNNGKVGEGKDRSTEEGMEHASKLPEVSTDEKSEGMELASKLPEASTNGKSEGSNKEGSSHGNPKGDKGRSHKAMNCCLPLRSRSTRQNYKLQE